MTAILLAIALLGQPDNIDRSPLPDPRVEIARWRVAHGLHPDPAAPPGTPIPATTPLPPPPARKPPAPMTWADMERRAWIGRLGRRYGLGTLLRCR